MPKAVAVLLAFTFALLVLTPMGSATSLNSAPTVSPSDLQTKVFQDQEGNVHVLWLVPARNNSQSAPGIWYSKYDPNGTTSVPPTRITNSTTIQSADLTVTSQGDAVIVWADDTSRGNQITSLLDLLMFNSTVSRTLQVLSVNASIIMWPSVATDSNGTNYLTWTQFNPKTRRALVEYGVVSSGILSQEKAIAAYDVASVFPPKARVIFDTSSRHLQIAWGESQKSAIDSPPSSTINYVKLVSNGSTLTRLLVAKFSERLRDVSITGRDGQDGAFVFWQTETSNDSIYVSQISATGELTYLKQLNYTSTQPKYLAVSSDPEGNLFVVWYQPTLLNPSTSATSAPVTDVSYVRVSIDGDVLETGNGAVRASIIAVTVSSDGDIYGVSPSGLVAITPSTGNNISQLVDTVMLVSCIGVAGSIWPEESRYRIASLLSAVGSHKPTSHHREITNLLARSPGLTLREIKRARFGYEIGMLSLVKMEQMGAIASFRQGFSRRFYARPTELISAYALRTRILLWVREHPGIWEAQLAKDLGLSQQIVHYHLKRLRDSRLISTSTDSSGGRKLYLSTSIGPAPPTEDTRSSEQI